jgi:rRNA pseudouridine-1189 N-methylase Emg1 (Nep1/Mra1 family)
MTELLNYPFCGDDLNKLEANEVPKKLHRVVALIINWVKTASITSDNKPLGDVMDDVVYCCLSQEMEDVALFQ